MSVAAEPDRFARVVVANTGLPTGERRPTEAFLGWQKFAMETTEFPVGRNEDAGRASDELGGGIAEKPLGGRIAVPDDSFLVESEDRLARGSDRYVPVGVLGTALRLQSYGSRHDSCQEQRRSEVSMKRLMLAVVLGPLLVHAAVAQTSANTPSTGFTFDVYGDSRSMMYLPYKASQEADTRKLMVDMFDLVLPEKYAAGMVDKYVKLIYDPTSHELVQIVMPFDTRSEVTTLTFDKGWVTSASVEDVKLLPGVRLFNQLSHHLRHRKSWWSDMREVH